MTEASRLSRYSLRFVALFYLAALLMVPVAIIFYRTFEHGLSEPIDALTSPEGMHAFWLTMICVGIAVPLNTVFGVTTALVLVRQKFFGRGFFNSLIDLPFAISPVVIGLSLILIYGPNEAVGGWLENNGIQVIFSVPGMVLATIFVSLPFVVREVMPVLQEIGTEQEQAAETLGASPWQTFWRVTLPSIRWGVTYGVVLATARALGEFGAVSVVSGKVSGETETLPLFVQSEFRNFKIEGAYAAAIVLAIIALVVLFGMSRVQRRAELRPGMAAGAGAGAATMAEDFPLDPDQKERS
jgi:sulfate/thiosulfate transport system permease protein